MPKSLSLYELNSLVSSIIAIDLPDEYWVEAEISETREVRGHCYMELVEKDELSNTPIARVQMMVIEFARNVLGYKDANSREMDEKTPHNVIDIMEEQKNISNMGGTMRLGAYECVLKQGSRVFNIYKKEHIQERHRHRYEFNNEFLKEYEKHGMMCVGRNPESDLVEIVEIPGLKWYIGTQYHPEYQSTVLKPHPLFVDFVKTAIANKK